MSVWICLKGSNAIFKDGYTFKKWSPYTMLLAFLSGADFRASATAQWCDSTIHYCQQRAMDRSMESQVSLPPLSGNDV